MSDKCCGSKDKGKPCSQPPEKQCDECKGKDKPKETDDSLMRSYYLHNIFGTQEKIK